MNQYIKQIGTVLFYVLTGAILATHLQSCTYLRKPNVDAEFTPYVKGFEYVTRKKFDYKSMTFNSKVHPTIGECFPNGTLDIDAPVWYTMSKKEKISLFFHEMFHCYCGQPHDNRKFEDGCYISFMGATQDSPECLEKHWKELMNDAKVRCDL